MSSIPDRQGIASIRRGGRRAEGVGGAGGVNPGRVQTAGWAQCDAVVVGSWRGFGAIVNGLGLRPNFSNFIAMKSLGLLVLVLLAAVGSAFSQVRQDSSFSLFFNGGISFTHANDPHINRWLEKYGYPTVPHTPTSINFELAAIPTNSRLLYSIRLSTIKSSSNLSSYNAMLGLYTALFKSQTFLLYAGGSVGLHGDIIHLNGAIPVEYQQLDKYNDPLALRRRGPVLEPAVRALWYPIRIHSVQIGVYGGLGYDLGLQLTMETGLL